MTSLLEFEAEIRITSFIAIFLTMALWELKTPYRKLRFTKQQRWPHQFGLIAIDIVTIRLLFPTAAAGTALYVSQQQIGIMNWLGFSIFFASLAGFILLDCLVYWQHVLSHRLDWFWRLHRTHHADTDYDLTTGLRFHPFELIISMLIKISFIFLLGIPIEAVILFEITLSGSALFNHSNIKLPDNIEPIIRSFIVTPSMHRIHHSTHRFEHDSNYGFFLSIWDRWFNSYTDKPEQNDKTMEIGLVQYRNTEDIKLKQILMIPFKKNYQHQ